MLNMMWEHVTMTACCVIGGGKQFMGSLSNACNLHVLAHVFGYLSEWLACMPWRLAAAQPREDDTFLPYI